VTAPRAGASDPVARFAEVAERFCAWAENPPEVAEWELETAIRFLLELTARALDLPDADVDDDEDTPGPDDAATKAVYDRFSVLPAGLYATVDPEDVAGDSQLVGDVLDDLADVWRDVRTGLDAHRADRVDEACWQWRFSFRSHWGWHATEALRVLVAKLHLG
jgi:hypothetical protein